MAVEAVTLGHKLEATLGERGFLHEARGLFQTVDERLRNGTLDGAFVFDAHEGTLIILSVVQHVQAALRAALEVGGPWPCCSRLWFSGFCFLMDIDALPWSRGCRQWFSFCV